MGETLRLAHKYGVGRENIWRIAVKAVLLITFLAGILLANVMGQEASEVGVLNHYFIEKFKYSGVSGENLFFYIFGERMPFLLLLCLLAFSSLGIAAGIVNLGWQGFSIGFMLSTAIVKYGGKGILLVLGGMFPQYLVYIPVYICYCGFTVFLHRRISGAQGGTMDREHIRNYGAGMLLAVLLMLVFITGIFLESYINPLILKKILKIF